MVIDKAHCVSHWGTNFCKQYGTLGSVCAFLPRDTPIVAVTATLTACVRRDLHSKLDFLKSIGRFHNAGNDRPNMSLVVRSMEHLQNSFADLDFVIPENISSIDEIPKTYIYADNIKTGGKIVKHLKKLMSKRGITNQGCNVSDVDVIVQWKLPKSLSQFVQRAGRAARQPGHKGLAVLLVERAAYSKNIEILGPAATAATEAAQKCKSRRT
ncbi:uncharacterized protein PHACADRAFT_164002 [Phanerochaete carnosa HHB-10118-sp]|uniref:DNA 3'-5' helicase n=1 Tax=Phanerochaete carnosa (strain HHB-10118-sp) TaxID=650164 RepID=K5UUK5_PHACS|nr:uncharacterized protein PHACADRAFT_164002 [Phanerochaete carnosa HHB-10118-sp]EKM53696.1 hypothetical protein PHACADRAFT_164002 [Phanerochaete carnosa HHB-10118-sp]